jgi:hypothetical protein
MVKTFIDLAEFPALLRELAYYLDQEADSYEADGDEAQASTHADRARRCQKLADDLESVIISIPLPKQKEPE